MNGVPKEGAGHVVCHTRDHASGFLTHPITSHTFHAVLTTIAESTVLNLGAAACEESSKCTDFMFETVPRGQLPNWHQVPSILSRRPGNIREE
jgi:hypothetical protein